MVFLLFLLAGIGLTSIIVDSEFFAKRKEAYAKRTKLMTDKDGLDKYGNESLRVQRRRKWFYLVNCYQCSGFWVGFLLGALVHPMADWLWYHRPLEWLLCGGAVSYASQVGMALYNYLNVQYGSNE